MLFEIFNILIYPNGRIILLFDARIREDQAGDGSRDQRDTVDRLTDRTGAVR